MGYNVFRRKINDLYRFFYVNIVNLLLLLKFFCYNINSDDMKDNKLFISIVSIFTIISFIIGISYAYFVPIIIGNDTASNHNTKAGTLKLTYNGTNVLNLNNASPGDSSSTTFTVTNSGTLKVDNYEIYFSKLINTFINNEVVYTLTCLSSDTNPCLNKEQSPVPTTE